MNKFDKKTINHITDTFSKYDWFKRVEHTTYKKEYMIFVDKYPYAIDSIFKQYESEHNVRIKVHSIY
jgi:hypothetical protein